MKMNVVNAIVTAVTILAGLISIWADLSDKRRYRVLLLCVNIASKVIAPIYVLLLLLYTTANVFDTRLPFVSDMPQMVHVIGVLITLCVIVGLLLSERRSRRPPIQETHSMGNAYCYGKREMQEVFMARSARADEVIILGGRGLFLGINDETESEQFQEIFEMRAKCKILLNDTKENERATDKLHKLWDDGAGAEIKAYPTNESYAALRGRLLIGGGEYSALLCNDIGDGKFDVLELRDRNIVKFMCDSFKEILTNTGTNVFIKYVCFDLAGVYFSGNIGTFYDKLRGLGLPIDVRDQDHLCVGDKVNLEADYTIIDHLKKRFSNDEKTKNLIEKKENDIVRAWSTTWKLNLDVQRIAKKLREQGYKIAICSNCDGMNGDRYKLSGAFQGFDTFLSYEVKKLKPNKEYFDCILERYKCFPYEVLFVDDHQKNTEEAEKMGFETILVVDRDAGDAVKAEYITNELERHSIRINR